MSERGRKFVLFDFDGVIADSFAVNREVSKRICPHITEEMHRTAFETNIHDAYPELIKGAHGPECHHNLRWEDEYIPLFRKSGRLFSGIADAITHLAQDYQLLLVSSAATNIIREFLEKHSLAGYFVDIMGNDVHRSKIEKMRMIFNAYDTTAGNCIFITDTLGDMREAQAHAVGTIGCSWGVHPHETLQKGIPFRVVDHPSELPDAVGDYFAQNTPN
mgnify:CR=1 FL=1